jgi:hypothetical protein
MLTPLLLHWARQMRRKHRLGRYGLATAFLLAGVLNAQSQQPEPALVGSVSFDAPGGQLQRIIAEVGDGGTGPYPAALVGDTSLSTHTIFRPRDLSAFGGVNRLPIVAWGNGACRNNSGEYRNFLAEIASHGYLVVAIGPAAHTLVLGSGAPGGGTQSTQLWDGVEWAIAQNGAPGSEYFDRIDVDRIALMGHSCGGVQALDVSSDPRTTTTMVWNSGVITRPRGAATPPRAEGDGQAPPRPSAMAAMTKQRLSELHAPVAYIIGGPSDIAYENGLDDFERINHVPVVFASQDVGHYPATFLEPHGGAWGVAAVAWLNWQLKGDESAASAFVGPECGLCEDPAWTIRAKNLR